jgi:hypothetical protein
MSAEPDRTLAQFCAGKGFSKAFFYELRKRGLAPDVVTYPGSRVIRITSAAEQKFDRRMAALARTKAAEIEAERRRAIAVTAAKIAAASPLHVSRRKRRARG